MWSDKFVDVPLAVSPIGDIDLLGRIGWGGEDITTDEWEDVDLDAGEMKVDPTRLWWEELE